ncbi:hypothetical protein FEM48_Zijuj06G0162100 [Ziziphus jujuba var. spinosa]|uniref:Uncharacterized protein n=1 Tax=Ziziphus jujuba var. spinosa TaxID=714518 RepID=A0A978VAA9_ZIZJJ|nr:hypothetical protein FEM48_Zijuj06G0162100 [Ziziphus jujuba var. spinosa]
MSIGYIDNVKSLPEEDFQLLGGIAGFEVANRELDCCKSNIDNNEVECYVPICRVGDSCKHFSGGNIHYRNREEYGRTDVMKVGLSYRSNYRFVFLSNCLLLDSILPSSSYRSPFLCCFKFQSKCRHLPALHELPRLQKLTLQRLNCLEYIDDDQNTATSCDIIPFFPSLKVLCILWCPKLTSMPLFPSLEWLVLQDTSSKPLLGTMMMAHKEASSGASPSSSFQSLSKLVEMTIVDIDDLQSLPQEGFTDLIVNSFLDSNISSSSCQYPFLCWL